MKVEVYTDGSCSLNNVIDDNQNGKGGFGYCIVVDGELSHTYYENWSNTTNNRMEMRAMISAINYCMDHYKDADIVIYTDSALIVNCIKQKWYKKWLINGWRNSKREAVKNKDLWKIMLHSTDAIKKDLVTIEKVSGHRGNPYNELADSLANTWRSEPDENFNIDKE